MADVAHVRGVAAVAARYERLYDAYAARTRRHVAAMQELAALREEVKRLRTEQPCDSDTTATGGGTT